MEEKEQKKIEEKNREREKREGEIGDWKEHVELLKQSKQEEQAKQEEFYQKIKPPATVKQILRLPDFDKDTPLTIFEKCFYHAFNIRKDPETAKHLLNIFRDDLKKSSVGIYILVKSTMQLIDHPEIFISSLVMEENGKKCLPDDSKRVEKIYNRSQEDNPVMIVGETGTGKGLLAKLIHKLSPRKDQKFEVIDCLVIPENLLESELFGYKKGAFTDAKADKDGILKIADKGTVFLDELGKMPDRLQRKLLKAVEEKEIRPLGSKETEKIDVRFITAAQPKDAKHIIPDLRWRIGISDPIELPTLDQELKGGQEKCEYRIKYSLNQAKKSLKLNKDIKINERAYSLLVNHKYKGNFRELESILTGAIRSMGDARTEIQTQDLVDVLRNSMKFDTENEEESPLADGTKMKNIKLKNLFDHANEIRKSIIETKIKSEMQRTGLDLKSLCEKEGIEYYNFRKKIVTITGKRIKEFGL